MNTTLQNRARQLEQYARQQLIDGLNQCRDGQVKVFKRMYAYKHLDWSIEQVVEAMPEEKLDWALTQVETTLKKLATQE
jgi:hypothetical protein